MTDLIFNRIEDEEETEGTEEETKEEETKEETGGEEIEEGEEETV